MMGDKIPINGDMAILYRLLHVSKLELELQPIFLNITNL